MKSRRSSQSGFSMIEVIVVVALLTIIMGAVFQRLIEVQQRSRTEDMKLDLMQEAREFIDNMVRDIHQAGYPPSRVYDPTLVSFYNSNALQDHRVANGLVKVTPTQLVMEGDVDGDGQVDVVIYNLAPDLSVNSSSTSCPCKLQRSDIQPKSDGDPVTKALASTNYAVELSNVVNSGGAGGSGPGGSLGMWGSTTFANGTTTANQTLYSNYLSQQVFTAYDQYGQVVTLPVDIDTSPTTIASIKTIQVTLNILSPQQDVPTLTRPVVTLTATGRINN